jgi:hypothetical protein
VQVNFKSAEKYVGDEAAIANAWSQKLETVSVH